MGMGNKYLVRIYYLPGTVLNASQILSYLIFITTMKYRLYYEPHFPAEEMEADLPRVTSLLVSGFSSLLGPMLHPLYHLAASEIGNNIQLIYSMMIFGDQ